jgi:hypothetical protein
MQERISAQKTRGDVLYPHTLLIANFTGQRIVVPSAKTAGFCLIARTLSLPDLINWMRAGISLNCTRPAQ